MNKRFLELIKKGWELQNEVDKTNYIDEVFIGGLTTNLVENNYILLNINNINTGNEELYNLLFENVENNHRFSVGVIAKYHSLEEIKVIGNRMLVNFSYGIPVKKMSQIVKNTYSIQLSKGLSNIGSISFNYDNYYLYVECLMYLLIDDYLDFDTLEMKNEKLTEDLKCIMETLKQYIDKRLEV